MVGVEIQITQDMPNFYNIMKKEEFSTMKKMMAKLLTAAMLLSAVPAVLLPSIQAEASKAIRFNYTTAFCEDFEPNDSNRVALRQTLQRDETD